MTDAKHIAHSNVASILYEQRKIETAGVHKFASVNYDPEVVSAFLKMKRRLQEDREPEGLSPSSGSLGTWEMLATHLCRKHCAVVEANINSWAVAEGHSVQAEQSELLSALHAPILFRFVDYAPDNQRWPSKPQVNKFYGIIAKGGRILPLRGRT
jgi:hypothetical protein